MITEAPKEKGHPGEGGPDQTQHTQARKLCAADFMAAPPSGQVAKFTALRALKPMGKVVWEEGGEVRSRTPTPPANFKHCPVEVATIEDLADAFKKADEWVVFISGTGNAAVGELVRRTKESFPLAAGTGVMFVDNDTHHGGDQFQALYVKACPSLAEASYVHAPSSSAYIYDSEGGELVGAKGQHYAIPVLDALDIPRALESLHKRCILAGFGAALVYENGKTAVRSPVDTAMATSCQPLFQRVTTKGDLAQRKEPRIEAHCGEVFLLDTRQAIPSLSIEEQGQFAAIEQELRLSVADEAARVKDQYIAVYAPKMAQANGWSQDRAVAELEKSLKQAGNGCTHGPQVDLWAGMKINFAKFGLVDVADVLAEPDRFHGQTCDDPLEPSYKPGSGVAKCYIKDKAGKHHDHPGVHTLAHGSGTVYHLKRDLSHIAYDLDAAKQAQDARKALAMGVALESSSEPVERALVGLPATAKRQVFAVSEFMSEMTPKFWILQKVLAKGWLYALAASPGAGKTAVALLLTLRAAMGQQFAGRKVSKSKVLYLCGENPQDVRGRFDALLRRHDMTLPDVEGQVFFTKTPFNIDDRQDLDAFIADAHQHGPFDLCVIDTQKAHSGAEDEDRNSESHELAQAMRRLGAGIGDPCILTLSHPTKAPTRETLLPRGGSAFTGSIDGVLCLWRANRGGPSELFTHKDKFRGEQFEGEFFRMDADEHPTLVDNFGDPDITVVASEMASIDTSGLTKVIDSSHRQIYLDKITEACSAGKFEAKTYWSENLGANKKACGADLDSLLTMHQIKLVQLNAPLSGRQGKEVLVPFDMDARDVIRVAANGRLADPQTDAKARKKIAEILKNLGVEHGEA